MGLFSRPMRTSDVARWRRKHDFARLVEALHYGWDGHKLSFAEDLGMRQGSRDKKAKEVREAAAYALAQMDDVTETRVIGPLITSLDDTAVIADVAQRALEKLTKESFRDPVRWRAWWKQNEHDRQLLREPLRSRRKEVWSEKEQEMKRAHGTPLRIEGMARQLAYGDYWDEAEASRLRQQVTAWETSRDEQLAPRLAEARRALEQKWRAQEDAWRGEDEAWLEEQRRLGVSVLPSAPQILLRCPSCGADLQERSVSLMTWRKGALVRESASLCKYCRGTLP